MPVPVAASQGAASQGAASQREEQKDSPSIVKRLAELDDPREGPIYSIEGILLLTVCAVICGANTFVDVEQFGEVRLGWLRGLLPFEDGTPSHDTIGGLLGRVEPEAFERCFLGWKRRVAEQTEGEVVALDGKTLRGSYDNASDKAALHMVEAWASEQELVLGQKRSDGGKNEIETIPKLLSLLHVEGCIVTIDARVGCQKKIAEAITDQNADYVLALKDNQQGLRADVERLFEERLPRSSFSSSGGDGNGRLAEPDCEQVSAGHGRVAVRRCWAVSVDGRGIVDEEGWPELRTVAMIESERFVAEPSAEEGRAEGQAQVERHYVVSSLEYVVSSLEAADAEEILKAKRDHWRIENGLHWRMDVSFREDSGQSPNWTCSREPRNCATLRARGASAGGKRRCRNEGEATTRRVGSRLSRTGPRTSWSIDAIALACTRGGCLSPPGSVR